MKFDDSLLTSPNPITLDDLKTYFRKNDFTSSVNPFEPISVRPNGDRIYPKIRSCFVEAWNRSLKKLGIDLYGKQYSENAPLNILKQADSKIVTEAVLDIIEDAPRRNSKPANRLPRCHSESRLYSLDRKSHESLQIKSQA